MFLIYIFFTKRINTFWHGGISSIWGIAHFELKKSDKIHQYFELYQVFMYKFLCEIVLIFSIIHIIDKKESIYFGLEARCGPKESAKKK